MTIALGATAALSLATATATATATTSATHYDPFFATSAVVDGVPGNRRQVFLGNTTTEDGSVEDGSVRGAATTGLGSPRPVCRRVARIA